MDTRKILKLLWVLPLLFFFSINLFCWIVAQIFSKLSEWTALASNFCEIKMAGKIITTDEEVANKLKGLGWIK